MHDRGQINHDQSQEKEINWIENELKVQMYGDEIHAASRLAGS